MSGIIWKKRLFGRSSQSHSRSMQAVAATTAHDCWVDPLHYPMIALASLDRCRDRFLGFGSYLRAISGGQLALASSGWIVLLCMQYLAPGSTLRTLVVFGFVLFCPGLAIAALVPVRESAERWVLAVSLSVSFGLLVSVAFTVVRNDSVTLRIGALALITTTAVLAGARWAAATANLPRPK